jgi:hypothetical protein
MIRRLKRLCAVSLGATTIIGGVLAVTASANVLTPEACTSYANRAIKDFKDTSKKPRCVRRENNRWHKDYDRHYQWCLTALAEPVKTERDVRNGFLTRCGARTRLD